MKPIPWRALLSLGVIDIREDRPVKRIGKFFDFMMLLIIFWLPLQWYLEARNELDPDFIFVANWAIWGFFVLEAIVMTSIVKRKLYYLTTNWLNLFIIVAIFPPWWFAGSTYFALLRYLRMIVLVRLLLPQLYNLHRILTRNHFGTTLGAALIVILLGGVLITYVDPSMGTPWDGIWWAMQTVTTVGYGDVIPDTAIGKVFATVLMVIGVGVFSLVAANMAAYFIERGRRQEKKPERALQKEFAELKARLTQIESCNDRLEKLLKEALEKRPPESEA